MALMDGRDLLGFTYIPYFVPHIFSFLYMVALTVKYEVSTSNLFWFSDAVCWYIVVVSMVGIIMLLSGQPYLISGMHDCHGEFLVIVFVTQICTLINIMRLRAHNYKIITDVLSMNRSYLKIHWQ